MKLTKLIANLSALPALTLTIAGCNAPGQIWSGVEYAATDINKDSISFEIANDTVPCTQRTVMEAYTDYLPPGSCGQSCTTRTKDDGSKVETCVVRSICPVERFRPIVITSIPMIFSVKGSVTSCLRDKKTYAPALDAGHPKCITRNFDTRYPREGGDPDATKFRYEVLRSVTYLNPDGADIKKLESGKVDVQASNDVITFNVPSQLGGGDQVVAGYIVRLSTQDTLFGDPSLNATKGFLNKEVVLKCGSRVSAPRSSSATSNSTAL